MMIRTGLLVVAVVVLAGVSILGFTGCRAPAEPAEQQTNVAVEEETEVAEREFEVHKTEDEWREELTEAEFRILREAGTEPAFDNEYWDNKQEGVYHCAGCGNELFHSENKFKSGTGWPSFTQPVEEGAVLEREDKSHGMTRTEIICADCGGHLGHVFTDGPEPTGLRYCMNSTAMDFEPAGGAEEDRQ